MNISAKAYGVYTLAYVAVSLKILHGGGIITS